MRKLNKLARIHNQTIYFRRFDLELIQNANTDSHYGVATYFRIHLPELLGKYSYLLYLDSDLIAASDFTSIFSQLPTGSECIAARPTFRDESYYHNQRLGRPLDMPYFNAGVLLIDVVRWREKNCTEGIMSILRNASNVCMLADQDALIFFFMVTFMRCHTHTMSLGASTIKHQITMTQGTKLSLKRPQKLRLSYTIPAPLSRGISTTITHSSRSIEIFEDAFTGIHTPSAYLQPSHFWSYCKMPKKQSRILSRIRKQL